MCVGRIGEGMEWVEGEIEGDLLVGELVILDRELEIDFDEGIVH